MQNNLKKETEWPLSQSEGHVRYLDSVLSDTLYLPFCLFVLKEAETLRRTISDQFYQINMYYFQKCGSCYWQRFFFFFSNAYTFNMVLYPCSYPPGFPHQDAFSHLRASLAADTKAKINKLKVRPLRETTSIFHYIYIPWPIIIKSLNSHHQKWKQHCPWRQNMTSYVTQ